MIRTLGLSLASKSSEIRRTLETHAAWLRRCFGSDLSGVVQLRFDYSLASLAAYEILGQSCCTSIPTQGLEVLRNRLQRLEFPPEIMPAMAFREVSLPRTSRQWSARWLDCPVAFHFSGLSGPVIAANIPYVEGTRNSDWREVVLALDSDMPALLGIVGQAFGKRRSMKIVGEADRDVQPLDWEDIVLDESVLRLVKDDFLLFLQREKWYKAHRLPFRRGYLLHGPPGNGKSSVIRAMLSTPGVTGFTLNPFRPFADEDLLAVLFENAAQATPAVVVLEDIDRCYPLDTDRHPQSSLSLQQLLNHLDGVASQDGIIVVATANNPGNLDSAILRRPGRFDRVVGFQNPSEALRKRYLAQLCGAPEDREHSACARMTAGFSFAQLRETYILAGQLALEEDGRIDGMKLTSAAQMLGETMMLADRKWSSPVGFREAS